MVKHEQPWLKVAANLKVDRSRGVAPHKPLLLLVVAGLVEEGKLAQPVLPLTGELTFRFLAFWAVASLETGVAAFLLKRMAGRRSSFPAIVTYWPDKTHLAWHRANTFIVSRNNHPQNRLEVTGLETHA